jgi:sulfofructose kinase
MALSSNSKGRARPVVLCAGITVEDFIFKVERFPAPGEKLHAQSLLAITGGCAANAAVAVARLGGIARFAGPVGTDDASGRIIAGLAREGVDVSGVERVDGGSVSISGIFIDSVGEKMVATRRGEKLAAALPRDAEALVSGIDVVMADNRFPDFVQPICEAARARGIAVIVDGDRATQLGDPLFAIATHVVFSSEALRATSGCSDLLSALNAAAAVIEGFLAVTNGPAAVLWMDKGAVRAIPVFAVEAIDTLGAGDTFHGAFALALAEGQDVVAAMRFAAAAAAVKCTRFGGISGTPLRGELEAFLSARAAGLK